MPVELKRVSQDTLYIVILTTVTILVWLGVEIGRTLTKTEVAPGLKQQLEPLPAAEEATVWQELKQRINWTEELGQVNLAPTDSGKRVSMESATGEGELR